MTNSDSPLPPRLARFPHKYPVLFVCLVCCGLSRLWLVSVAVWVATPVAQTAAFVVQVAGPVAGMAGGVAALFRPEAGPCF